MIQQITDNRNEVYALCRQHRVERLGVFGSGLHGAWDATRSDLDFLVVFQTGTPLEHYERYFGLKEGLERLFGRPVDLVEPQALRNPYFKQAVSQACDVVYAA